MDYEWTIFFQEEVQTGRTIPIPAAVHSVVGFAHELHGPCVHWNYERNANYIVLSEYPLREPNYVDVSRTKIYDIDGEDQQKGRIRIPDGLDEMVKSHFLEGTRVNYMAYERMVDQENPAVFLLSNSQFQQLLPATAQQSVTGTEDDADLEQSLLNLPAFLPSP